MKLIICFLILIVSTAASAQWTTRPVVGVGYTNNANYEDEDKDSDLFWWLRTSSTKIDDETIWNIWLNFKDFLKEHQNDVFNYRFGRTEELRARRLGSFDWDFAVGGQSYLRGSPATTEESFDNFYSETSLLKTIVFKNNLEAAFEPLYQIRFFPRFEGRVDHTLLLNSELSWNLSPTQTLIPYLELGMTFSSQSLYSKNYHELGSEWRFFPQPNLTYFVQLLSRFSSFPHREVSESTVISSGNGRSRTVDQSGTETQTFFQAQATVARIISRTELRGSLALNSQSTRSGIDNFQEVQAQTSLLIPF